MDGERFDGLTRALATASNRRRLVATVAGGLAGGMLGFARPAGGQDRGQPPRPPRPSRVCQMEHAACEVQARRDRAEKIRIDCFDRGDREETRAFFFTCIAAAHARYQDAVERCDAEFSGRRSCGDECCETAILCCAELCCADGIVCNGPDGTCGCEADQHYCDGTCCESFEDCCGSFCCPAGECFNGRCCPPEWQCGDGECCPPEVGVACAPAEGICCDLANNQVCGGVCCDRLNDCCNDVCCEEVCCGGACCDANEVCVGDACCPTGQCCASGHCFGSLCCAPEQQCGQECCGAAGDVCAGGVCCPSERVCGESCCGEGQTCVQGACEDDTPCASDTTHDLSVVCSSAGQLCEPPASVGFTTACPVQVAAAFTAAARHCSEMVAHLALDGAAAGQTAFLGPGQSSGVLALGTVGIGAHTLSIQAEGRVGGCNTGELLAWFGAVRLILTRLA